MKFPIKEPKDPHANDDLHIRQTDNRPRCEKCGRPFDPAASTKGHLGICQQCAS
jgi:hypothetical protein